MIHRMSSIFRSRVFTRVSKSRITDSDMWFDFLFETHKKFHDMQRNRNFLFRGANYKGVRRVMVERPIHGTVP